GEELLARGFRRVLGNLQKEVIGVSQHGSATEHLQSLEGLPWLRPSLQHVSETDHLVDADAVDVVDGRLERDVVRVLVGYQRQPGQDVTSPARRRAFPVAWGALRLTDPPRSSERIPSVHDAPVSSAE